MAGDGFVCLWDVEAAFREQYTSLWSEKRLPSDSQSNWMDSTGAKLLPWMCVCGALLPLCSERCQFILLAESSSRINKGLWKLDLLWFVGWIIYFISLAIKSYIRNHVMCQVFYYQGIMLLCHILCCIKSCWIASCSRSCWITSCRVGLSHCIM